MKTYARFCNAQNKKLKRIKDNFVKINRKQLQSVGEERLINFDRAGECDLHE